MGGNHLRDPLSHSSVLRLPLIPPHCEVIIAVDVGEDFLAFLHGLNLRMLT